MKLQIIRINPIVSSSPKPKPKTNTIIVTNTLDNKEPFIPPIDKPSPYPKPYPLIIIKTDNISFGYKSILKTEWLKGNLPSVKKGIYGGTLTPKNITLEHIIPHSKGGKTELCNLALAVDINNWQRSDKPFKDYFDISVFNEYLDQFKDVNLPTFNGIQYINSITKLVRRVIKNGGLDLSKYPSLQ